jgi:hypothetical protein
MCRGTRTRSVGEVVDDERHDEPCDELRHPNARRRRSSRRRAARRGRSSRRRAARCAESLGRAALAKESTTSHAMCWGTRTRGVSEVVDDECATSRVTSRGTRTRGVGEVVNDEPRNVSRHPDAWRGRSSRQRAARCAESPRRAALAKESTTSHATCRTTCRGTRTHGVGEVVDDERSGELRDVRATCRGTWMRGVVEVDEDRRDEPRDVPRYPDAWRRQSSRRRGCTRRSSRR